MICYKDMTFCPYYRECKDGKDCSRALTDAIESQADKWWGKGAGEAPICMFGDKPECFKEDKNA